MNNAQFETLIKEIRNLNAKLEKLLHPTQTVQKPPKLEIRFVDQAEKTKFVSEIAKSQAWGNDLVSNNPEANNSGANPPGKDS